MNEIVPTRTIGAYVPMVDGPEKVSGRAKYTADLVRPDMLAGRIYRSPIRTPDSAGRSQVLRLPGVKAIVTGADCDKTLGVLPIARSEHPLARDRLRYRGELVAVVAAVDDATAEKALGRSSSRCASCPYYTARDAMAPGAVTLHDATEQRRARRVVELGNVEQGFGEADLVRGQYNCAEVCQNQMDARRGRRLRRRAAA